MKPRVIAWLCVVFVGMIWAGLSCAKSEPVSHFVIYPAGGASEISAPEVEKLKETLDGFSEKYRMAKMKAGQPGIIRYYQPNRDYEIGFFAKRTPDALRVYAQPMTPSVAGQKRFQDFRQNLADVLSQTFPGQVALEK